MARSSGISLTARVKGVCRKAQNSRARDIPTSPHPLFFFPLRSFAVRATYENLMVGDYFFPVWSSSVAAPRKSWAFLWANMIHKRVVYWCCKLASQQTLGSVKEWVAQPTNCRCVRGLPDPAIGPGSSGGGMCVLPYNAQSSSAMMKLEGGGAACSYGASISGFQCTLRTESVNVWESPLVIETDISPVKVWQTSVSFSRPLTDKRL